MLRSLTRRHFLGGSRSIEYDTARYERTSGPATGAWQVEPQRQGILGRLLTLLGRRPDPTRHWTKTDEPLPIFDLMAGALGGLRFEDGFEQAEFLGRPERVENPGWTRLYYLARGFQLYFEMGQFVELTCDIAPPPSVPPKPGHGFSRPRLSGDIQLTPESSAARVRELFGPPESEENGARDTTIVYPRGRYYMTFEFDRSSGRLLTWSAHLED
jgi:hypothetical protein